MDKKDFETLKKICNHITMIQSYCCNTSTFSDFENDSKTADAVILQLIQIGELAKFSLNEITKEQLSNIPWKKINGMRNRIVHGYDVINLTVVWETVSEDLPRLKQELENILHTCSNNLDIQK